MGFQQKQGKWNNCAQQLAGQEIPLCRALRPGLLTSEDLFKDLGMWELTPEQAAAHAHRQTGPLPARASVPLAAITFLQLEATHLPCAAPSDHTDFSRNSTKEQGRPTAPTADGEWPLIPPGCPRLAPSSPQPTPATPGEGQRAQALTRHQNAAGSHSNPLCSYTHPTDPAKMWGDSSRGPHGDPSCPASLTKLSSWENHKGSSSKKVREIQGKETRTLLINHVRKLQPCYYWYRVQKWQQFNMMPYIIFICVKKTVELQKGHHH